MKQSLFDQKLVDLFSKLELNHPYVLDGFHPDFFLSLYKTIDIPICLVVPDACFDAAVKYLSLLQDDDCVVFIPPSVGTAPVVRGFLSRPIFHMRRARSLLSSGVGRMTFIICSESGFSLPVVGAEALENLNITPLITFDECLEFFYVHDYRAVDIVLDPGCFCVRGGILDVYPLSSSHPVRLNFLDDIVKIYQFDVQTQLTACSLDSFSIAASQGKKLLPLKNMQLSNFLLLFYGDLDDTNMGVTVPVGFSKHATPISFDKFSLLDYKKTQNVFVDKNLTSMGAISQGGKMIVPPWFIKERSAKNYPKREHAAISLNINNIKRGDYLVHRDHGVGVCMGLLINNDVEGGVQELLSIKYEDGGVVRVDVCCLDFIDFYAPAGTEGVVLDSLQRRGSWARKRRSAQRSAEETIDALLSLYVRRNDISRPAFLPYNDLELQFFNDFPFEYTDDQRTVWLEISNDLSSLVPMDRLLCGDVGFGKTELAMRASFRVVLGNKRVLILAPTTILANQLYASFHARLGPYAVNVDMVSGFRTTTKNKLVQEKISTQKNDVLIGTHSLLNNSIYWKNIGLLVVDEEHRFGVAQKERIKCIKEAVDVLSLSATPIPRSLNLALSGIYSISLLQTPPLMRLPIITCVEYFDNDLIQRAVSFEVDRGGQVYFVHNNVQSIESVTHRLRGLFPELSVVFLHGQEHPRDIEEKMDLFISGNVDLLVCTSIIEAGIDVPNANCIIINNSHLFGLTQLYQIRGRVGRGDRQAYAYLIIPQGLSLSKRAFGRIKTIEENERLGSGYNISKSDMEQRGSGALFGYKQSGGSASVGYEMYLRLIQRSLHVSGQLNGGLGVLPEDVLIKVFKERYIPENYISVENLRLSFYKYLSSVTNEGEINNILYNLTNRFGPIPSPVNNLVKECRLRLVSAAAGVFSITVSGCGVVCGFVKRDQPDFIATVLRGLEFCFGRREVDFHLLPPAGTDVSVCIHFSCDLDKYSLLFQFLDKLKF